MGMKIVLGFDDLDGLPRGAQTRKTSTCTTNPGEHHHIVHLVLYLKEDNHVAGKYKRLVR